MVLCNERWRRMRSCSAAEEELLAQAQGLTGRRLVRRVEDARNALGVSSRGERPDVVAAVEAVQIDLADRPRRPKPQRIGMFSLPADHRRIVSDRVHGLARMPDVLQRNGFAVATDLLDEAAEVDRVDDLGTLELPRIAVGEPVFRRLVLPAVRDRLTEQAMLVADPVAVGRQADARHRLHEAGRQSAEAAVAERGVRFLGTDVGEVDAEDAEGLPRRLRQVQIGQRIHEKAPDQELDRKIVDLFVAGLMGAPRGAHPAINDAVSHGQGQRDEPVA